MTLFIFLFSFLIQVPEGSDSLFARNLAGFSHHADSNGDSALYYAQGMLAAAHESNDDSQIVRAEYALGYTYRLLNQYPEAIKHYRNAWQIARSHGLEEREIMAGNGLGMSFYLAGDYPEALRYLYSSMVLRQKRNNPEELATIYNNIGLVYLKLWNWEKAHEYFTLALVQRKDHSEPDAETLVNLATCLVYMRRFEEAHQTFARFEKVCSQHCSPGLWCDYFNAMGGMYLNQQDYASARIYFNKVLRLARDNHLEADQEIAYDNLSSLEARTGRLVVAREYADSAQAIALRLGIPHRIESNYRQLAEIENNLNHPEKSVQYWIRYDSMRRQVKGVEVMNEIYSREIEWIENAYAGELALQQQQISVTKRTNVIYLVLSVFVALLAFSWWYNYRKKKLALLNLERAQKQLVRQEKMAALGSLMAGIAHELNNPLSAALGSLSSGNQRLSNLLADRKSNNQMPEVLQLMQANAYSPGVSMVSGMERRRIRKEIIDKLKDVPEEEIQETAEQLIDLGIEEVTPELNEMLGADKAHHTRQLFNSFLLQRDLSRTEDALQNMRMVIQSLRDSSRGNNGSYSFSGIDLNSSIRNVLVLLHNQLKQGVELTTSLTANHVSIRANPQRISQVWLNLLVNAIQALPEGKGNLHIHADLRWKEFVRVEISDNGEGISPEDQPLIFDKFYTTRHTSGGSGLGLHIVKEILEEHDGSISFVSSSSGTRMQVFLPIT